MKIISLNTWGGKTGGVFFDFVKNNKNIDILCFQEVYFDAEGKEYDADFQDGSFNMFSDLEKILPEYNSFFNAYIGDFYGLAIFIKKDFKILEQGELFVYKHREYVPDHDIMGNHARNIQYIKIEDNGKIKNIINFHGLWNGKGKGDSEDRILQSKNIIDFLKTLEDKIILCGDFNLLPETKSLKMFEEFGLINLIKENNITSTRTSYYTKPEKFADYVFVSKDVVVRNFKVLPEEVSDHSALYIDIE